MQDTKRRTSRTRPSPVLEHAVDTLRLLIERSRRTAERTVPGVRGLAAVAGVSYVTAARAVARLVREGVLTVRPGRRTVLSSEGQSNALQVRTCPKSDMSRTRQTTSGLLAERIERDIAEGACAAGEPLPGVGQLAATHAVNYRTARRALALLVERRVIESYRRGYRVRGSAARRGQGTVVLVARANTGGRQQLFDARTSEKLRMLESQCAQSRVGLCTVPVEYWGDALEVCTGHAGFAQIMRDRAVLGFMVWAMGMSPRSVADLEARLASFGCPVALLDEDDALTGVALTGQKSRLYVSAGTRSCGVDIGRYLHRLGHRDIAYFTTFGDDAWSRNRLAGLHEVFRGASGGVQEFSAAVSVDDEAAARHVARTLATLRPLGIAPQAVSGASAISAATAEEQVRGIVHRRALGIQLQPLFEAARDNPAITAWVGANDDVALQCLEFLRVHSVDVPSRMSVIGFDDTFAATYWQMTSYSFRTAAVVSSMLAHVLRPDRAGRASVTAPAYEVDGMVVERATTAPVAG